MDKTGGLVLLYFARTYFDKPLRACLNVRMWCQVEMMRAKKKLTEEKKTYEKLKAQKCVQHTVRSTGTNVAGDYIDIAHHSATCSTNCYDYNAGALQKPCDLACSLSCESTADFGIAGEGRSSIEEKSIARFRRTSGASHHAMSCHNKHATTISAIRHSVEARGGTSIRGVMRCEMV